MTIAKSLVRMLGCFLIITVVATLVPAPAVAASQTPLEALKDRDPHEVLAWRDGMLVAQTHRLPPGEAVLAEELASGLNKAAAAGHLTISENLDVQATPAGVRSVTNLLKTSSRGCIELENIRADWLGFHADAVPVCTDEEMQRRVATQQPTPSKPDRGADGDLKDFATPMHPTDAGPIHTSDDFDCLLSVVGLAVAAVAVAALVTNPATGVWIWLSWGATGGGAFLSWVSFVLNCTGIRAVNQKVHTASGDNDYPCHFVSYDNYRWSWHGLRRVPTRVNYSC